MNPLRQITNYLKNNGGEPVYDKESRTLYFDSETSMGTIQTRFYFEEEMGVLSCQSIFTESFNAERFREMCVMANLFNEQLGFGMFLIMGEEDLVFEINNLIEEDTTISDALLEKLVNIPSEAMKEHLPAFLDVANKNALPQDVFDKFWND